MLAWNRFTLLVITVGYFVCLSALSYFYLTTGMQSWVCLAALVYCALNSGQVSRAWREQRLAERQ